MLKNNIVKATAIAAVVLAAIPVFASIAYGYGGGTSGETGGTPPSSPGVTTTTSGSGTVSTTVSVAPTVTTTTTTTTTPGQVLGASTYNFNADLWYHMKDNAGVAALQDFLVAEGYSIPDATTDYFGNETLAAVKAFQKANGIPQTGYVGPLTRAVLNKGLIQK